MSTLVRVAPVQGEYKKRPAGTVPWEIHEQAWENYAARLGKNQTAERIAERGGFGYREMQCLLAGHDAFGCTVEHDPVPGWIEKQ